MREFRIQVIPVFFFICVVTAVILLWHNFVQPVSVVGEVESVKANAASHQEGVLTKLLVDRFDRVTAGQVIGEIMRTDPQLLSASLATMKADLQVMRAGMIIDDQRRELNYESLRVDLMDQKVQLAAAQANLVAASNEFKRSAELLQSEIESASKYDEAKARMESLQAEIQERSNLIQDLTTTINRLKLSNQETTDNPIAEAVKAKEKELELNLQPILLKAPIDGVVSLVYRRVGESIIAGEPILTISSLQAQRVVGYIRQPMDKPPQINDKVEVRTRGQRRMKGEGQVLEIGAQMEPINPVLISTDPNHVELGLPILVSLPSGLEVRPGEVVDLQILGSK